MNTDFYSYAKSSGISSLNLDYHMKSIQASVTPMVVEDRPVQGTVISVFDRMMMDRIIWFTGPVYDESATVIQAQLMFLDSLSHDDITFYINSPGGGVYAGLSMIDVMDYVKSDIATVNVGMAASMGAVLLGAGAKGKRSALRFSRTMLHQSSGGASGNIQDAKIAMEEWNSINKLLFELLGKYCGKDALTVEHDAQRDLWLTSQKAIEYGIIDEIIK